MGTSIQELKGIITANITSFERGIQGAIRATEQFRSDFVQAARDIDTAATQITAAVGALSIGVTAAVVKTGVSFDDLKQRSLIAFETMLGSGEKAQAFFEQLAKFAANTPFELKGLLKNTQTMMGMGFEAEQIIPLLTAMGDAMAGMGKSGEDLDRLVMSFAQMQARGRITGEELREFAHNGIGALKMLADAAGVTTGEMQKMVEKGLIPADFATKVIVDGMNARFGGMMAKMVTTFTGVNSNLKDFFDQTAGSVVEPLFTAVTKGLNDLYAALQGPRFAGVTDRIKGQFQQLADSLEQFLGANMETVVDRLGAAFEGLVSVGTKFVKWATDAGPEIARLGEYIWGLIQSVMEWVGTHPQVIAWLILLKGAEMMGVLAAVQSLASLLMSLGPAIAGVVGAMGPWGIAIAAVAAGLAYVISQTTDLQSAWEEIKSVGEQLWTELQPAVEELGAAFGDALVPVVEELKEMFIELAPVVADLAKELGPALADVIKALAPAIKELTPLFVEFFKTSLQPGILLAKEIAREFTAMAEAIKLAMDALALATGGDIAEQVAADKRGKELNEQIAARQRGEGVFDLENAEDVEGNLPGGGDFDENAPGGEVEAEKPPAFEGLPGGMPALPQKPVKTPKKEKTFEDLGEEDGEKAMKAALGDISLDLANAADALPESQFNELQTRLQMLSAAFREGDMTLEEFQQGARQLGQQVHAAEDFAEHIEKLKKSLSPEQVEGFNSRFEALLEKFNDGEITADGFRRGLSGLNDEMRDAARASDEAAKAKDRERLARGDFTTGEIQKAIQDRLISQQQHYLQQYVDSLLGLNNATTTATHGLQGFSDGLNNLSTTMQGVAGALNPYVGILSGSFAGGQSGFALPDGGMFGNMMSMVGGGGGGMFNGTPGALGNGFNMRVPFGMQAFGAGANAFLQGIGNLNQPMQGLGFADVAGLVNQFKSYVTKSDELQNEISIEQQKLGLGIGSDFNLNVMNQIAQLQGQLRSLRAPSPLFDRASNQWSGYAADPAKGAPGTISQQLNFPNITKLGNSEVSQLTDKIQYELRRRGAVSNV